MLHRRQTVKLNTLTIEFENCEYIDIPALAVLSLNIAECACDYAMHADKEVDEFLVCSRCQIVMHKSAGGLLMEWPDEHGHQAAFIDRVKELDITGISLVGDGEEIAIDFPWPNEDSPQNQAITIMEDENTKRFHTAKIHTPQCKRANCLTVSPC